MITMLFPVLGTKRTYLPFSLILDISSIKAGTTHIFGFDEVDFSNGFQKLLTNSV